MSKNLNPYPETIIDESSGVRVPNLAYRIWLEGYEAGAASAPSDESKWEAAG